MFLINPYILQASGSYNPLTQAWATNTGESDTTILDALNTFEQFLIDNSLTAKTPAFYPMVGGTSDKHKRNFLDSSNGSPYELTFFGGLTHSSTGTLPNGSTGYASTNYTPPDGDTGLFFYSRTDNNSLTCDIGAYSASRGSQSILFVKQVNASFSSNSGTFDYLYQSPGTSLGFFGVTRVGGNVTGNYRGTALTQAKTNVNTQITLNIFSRNIDTTQDLYSNRECAGAGMLVNYTAAELDLLRIAIENFNTSLSRNV